MSSVFQRGFGHLCAFSSNPRIISLLHVVGQLQSNDSCSWESVMRRIGRFQFDSKKEIAVID